MEDVGNFNYGATGRAAGYSREMLLDVAGKVQIGTGTSSWEFYDSNWDDPVDQVRITEGMDYYDELYNNNVYYGDYDWNFFDGYEVW